MANVITYGTFDLFHVGHLRLLQRALSIVRKELLYHGGPIGMILLPANWLTARSKSNVVICVEGMGRNSLIIMCLHIIFCAPIRLITSQWTIAGLIVRVIMACIKGLMRFAAKVGDIFHLPLNTERLGKLTEDSVVDNSKIKVALGWDRMPIRAEEGLRNTLKSF